MRDSSDTYLPKEISLVWLCLFEFNFFNDRQGIQAFFFLACGVYFSLPHLCLSKTTSINKRKQLWPPHLPLFCALWLWMLTRQNCLSCARRWQNVNAVPLVCCSNLHCKHLYTNLFIWITSHGPPTPTLHAFTGSTLLGCTALLRFSIHLSLSADERQEKHLLPEEVVTWCGERKRKHYDKTRMKNKKLVYKYHLCSL